MVWTKIFNNSTFKEYIDKEIGDVGDEGNSNDDEDEDGDCRWWWISQ